MVPPSTSSKSIQRLRVDVPVGAHVGYAGLPVALSTPTMYSIEPDVSTSRSTLGGFGSTSASWAQERAGARLAKTPTAKAAWICRFMAWWSVGGGDREGGEGVRWWSLGLSGRAARARRLP